MSVVSIGPVVVILTVVSIWVVVTQVSFTVKKNIVFFYFPSYSYLNLSTSRALPYCKMQRHIRTLNNSPFQTVEPEKLTRKFYKNNSRALLGDGADI